MRNNRRKNNIIIAGLCSVLLIMGIGYAAFASQLKITGTSKISSNWDIEITNIESTNIVGSASNKVEPTYTATTATFSTNLVSPGDSITYNVTIENKGTIDGVLKLVDKTDTSNSAINFDTSGVKQGDVLKVGEKTTYTVVVSYNSSVTSQPDNLSSTLTVTFDYIQNDGQDYSIKTAADTLIAKAVTSGDGLYADTYENGRYIYKGAAPDNYITFNNETWRILSVESDGTIKIIRNESIGQQYWASWNNGTTNIWADASLNTYLNNDYLNSIDSTNVVLHTWYIGAVDYSNETALTTSVANELSSTYNAKVGLISATDYVRTSTNKICNSLYAFTISPCTNDIINYSWVYGIVKSGKYNVWTITADKNTYGTQYAYALSISSYNGAFTKNSGSLQQVLPSLYLNSNITLNGSGTSSDPYVIQ